MPRRLWIIWLMLALLPLRGMAVATMEMPGAAAQVTGAEKPVLVDAGHGKAPCHEGADPGSGSADHACGLCDLCHSAVAVPPQNRGCAQPLQDVMSPPGLARDTGRHAIGRLDRPPRLLLA